MNMSARSKLGRMVRLSVTVASLGTASVAGIDPTAAQTAQFDGVYAGTQTLTDKSSGHNYSKCLKGPFKRKQSSRMARSPTSTIQAMRAR